MNMTKIVLVKCTIPKVIGVVVEAIIVEQSPVARWPETAMVYRLVSIR